MTGRKNENQPAVINSIRDAPSFCTTKQKNNPNMARLNDTRIAETIVTFNWRRRSKILARFRSTQQ